MTKTTFKVPGKPTGKGRPRVTKGGHVYTPAQTREYEEYVRSCAPQGIIRESQKDKPIAITIVATYPIPKSTTKKNKELMLNNNIRPTKKPDIDNIAKIIMDALNGLAYPDDSCIVELTACKLYGEDPGVQVTVEEVNNNDRQILNKKEDWRLP